MSGGDEQQLASAEKQKYVVTLSPRLRSSEDCPDKDGKHELKNKSLLSANENQETSAENNNKDGGGRCPEDEETLPPERKLAKLKKFLMTIQQFAASTTEELGRFVKLHVMQLIDKQLTVEQFYNDLQSTTKFPLRPFVVPFLKTTLPLLRHELSNKTRIAAMAELFPEPQQQQRTNLLRPFKSTASSNALLQTDANKKPSLLAAQIGLKRGTTVATGLNESLLAKIPRYNCDPKIVTPSEPSTPVTNPVKRKLDSNGQEFLLRPQAKVLPLHSRDALLSVPSSAGGGGGAVFSGVTTRDALFSSFASSFELLTSGSEDIFHRMQRLRLLKSSQTQQQLPLTASKQQNSPPCSLSDSPDDNSAKELKNIENLLTHLLGTVEQLRYALSMLQHRFRFSNVWNGFLRMEKDERVDDLKRKAELAVEHIRQQALHELQTAISAAEKQASEAIETEKRRLETDVIEVLKLLTHQEDSVENCWNCGRRANQTCSGCQLARYCGAFCQHRDWQMHRFRCCAATKTASSLASKEVASKEDRSQLRKKPRISASTLFCGSGNEKPLPIVKMEFVASTNSDDECAVVNSKDGSSSESSSRVHSV